MRFIGIHLIQPPGEIASPPQSTLAALNDVGQVEFVEDVQDDAGLLLLATTASPLIVLDAPVFVPNAQGRRMAEDVLAWCDINVFPASRERLGRLYGGVRGERLANRLERAGCAVHETYPEVVLRQLAWESSRKGSPPLDLASYREAWIGARGPRYATKRDEPGSREARKRALELLGVPYRDQMDRPGAIAALACAYAGLRSARPDLGATLSLPVGAKRRIVLPAGPELLSRAALHIERLTVK
jgi:predicted nuclease with RNAse H fold